MGAHICDLCNNYVYDEEEEAWFCEVSMDEDDLGRFMSGGYKECPYFQSANEYEVVKHQM